MSPDPVTARSKAQACDHSPTEILDSNPKGAWMFFCCVLSSRGLCDELITRPEESYRLLCVVMCELKISWMRRPWLTLGWSTKNKQTVSLHFYFIFRDPPSVMFNGYRGIFLYGWSCWCVTILIHLTSRLKRGEIYPKSPTHKHDVFYNNA